MRINTNFDEVKSILRACIISRKGGVPINELSDEYSRHTGTDIPYLYLGFSSLYDMIRNINEIKTNRDPQGNLVYTVESDELTKHISYLVSRQKDPVRSYIRKESRSSQNKARRIQTKPYSRPSQRSYESSDRNKNNKRPYFHSEGETTDHTSDEESYNSVIIEEPPKDLTRIHGPLINGQQMIGDDFFLQLAIRNLGQPIWRKRPCSPLHCGLCVSGMTIRSCTKALQQIVSVSNKIVIMLGTEDIYRGRSEQQIIEDFEDMLYTLHTCFAFSKSAIKICTLPPLANLNIYDHVNQLITHRAFNNYILNLAATEKYGLVDFYSKMTNANWETQYEFFQLDARMVSGSHHPYVLFNRRGRRLAANLLTSEKD